jgi:N-dimethylarginine dimethylaminohydrolase
MQKINTQVVMSGADYFDDGFAINSYMDDGAPVDVPKAMREHAQIMKAFKQAGIEVVKADVPKDCQDGVYTANWALTRGKMAVMANLPPSRMPELKYAEQELRQLGFEIIKLPEQYRFSGQGDALPCGNKLFTGTDYRTSPEVHELLHEKLGYEVISLQTVPEYSIDKQPVTNAVTGWPDSFFYDIDLAIAVLSPNLIAWCPEAFMPESQEIIHALADIDKIEVSLEEAMQASACNLVSTGETVVMGDQAPELKQAIEAKDLKVITVDVTELLKGGGFIRCTSLTLNNL